MSTRRPMAYVSGRSCRAGNAPCDGSGRVSFTFPLRALTQSPQTHKLSTAETPRAGVFHRVVHGYPQARTSDDIGVERSTAPRAAIASGSRWSATMAPFDSSTVATTAKRTSFPLPVACALCPSAFPLDTRVLLRHTTVRLSEDRNRARREHRGVVGYESCGGPQVPGDGAQ